MSSLNLFAGPVALQRLRDEGLHPGLFSVMAGASGGPKWFVLYGLDRYLFGEFFRSPVNGLATVGSSAGAWRLACLAQPDAVAAIDRLAELYSHENYSDQPTPREITDKARLMLKAVLGEEGGKNIVANATIKSHFIVNRLRGPAAHGGAIALGAGLSLAAAGNLLNRRNLGFFLERVVFNNHTHACELTRLRDLPTRDVKLSIDNVYDALLASGSIPFVLEGVRDIAGAPRGLYLDGGITDYHFDLPFHRNDGLVLYPHFYRRVIPGWFDKYLAWRRVDKENFANVLMVVPSVEFVGRLPYGKIPDRNDFRTLNYQERLRYWQTVLDESRRLADDFMALAGSNRAAAAVQAFNARQ